MKHIFILILAVMVSLVAVAQQAATVSWSGELTAGGQKLGICFNVITDADGACSCTMDVPAQSVKGLPVRLLSTSTDSLHVSIPMLMASYRGAKVSPSSIEGVFVQYGMSFPLNLTSGTLVINRPQTPVGPFDYVTEEVTFENVAEGAVLSGTLTYPVGYDALSPKDVPVVIMVTGSGAQNRDEELFDHRPFLVIADHLARNGIASLRYDDRGVGRSTGNIDNTTTENNLTDAEAGVACLRNMGKFGKVGVLGHSEGGTIAFMMGANGMVDFLVSLAGTAISGLDVIVGQNAAMLQLNGLPQEYIDNYCKALRFIYTDRVAQVAVDDAEMYIDEICSKNELDLPYAARENLAKCVTAGGAWFTWFLGYDPAQAIRKIECPVMALNGTLDMQVLCDDNMPVVCNTLPENKKHLIKEYEGLNHLFQHCTPATALSYGMIEETIAPQVLDDIVQWIIGL